MCRFCYNVSFYLFINLLSAALNIKTTEVFFCLLNFGSFDALGRVFYFVKLFCSFVNNRVKPEILTPKG